MKSITLLKRVAMLFMAAAVVISCSKADAPVVPPTVKIPHQLGLKIGKSEQLTAEVTPANMGLKWSSSNNAVATVDNTGKVTAVDDGTATITAETTDGKASDNCEVTVAETIINIDKETLGLKIGKSEQITATTDPEDAPVEWKSSDKTIATVDGTGKVTAVKEGTVDITAKAGKMTVKCVVTVADIVLTINKETLTLKVGKNEQLTATVDPDDLPLTWGSSNTEVATVDNKGNIIAKKAGTTDITVKAGEVTVKCVLTVPEIVISIDKKYMSVMAGESAQLTVTVDPDDLPVTWKSSDTDVATVEAGTVTVHKAGGTANISATAGDKTVSCEVYGSIPCTIYAIGNDRVRSGTPVLRIAKFWIDDKTINLTDGTLDASAEGLFVMDDYVYVVGFEGKAAKLWKINRQSEAVETQTLSDGTYTNVASGVYVSDGDVYISGYETVSYVNTAKFWKNNTPQPLPDILTGGSNSYAYSITGSGGEVYVAGRDYNQAVIWKINEGVKDVLYDGGTTKNGLASKVLISGGKVYVVGQRGAASPTFDFEGLLWIDGAQQTIGTRSRLYSVAVNGDDIYTVGDEMTATTPMTKFNAALWKNGEKTFLTDGTSMGAYAKDVSLLGNDAYTIGYGYYGTPAIQVAAIWKNDTLYKTLTSGPYTGNGTGIVVVPKL